MYSMCASVCDYLNVCMFICACVQGGCLLVYTRHSCKPGWWAHEAKGQQKASQPASLCFRFSPPIPSHNCHSLAWLTPLAARADSSFCRPNRHCYKSHTLCEKWPPPQQKLLINMWHSNDLRTWQKQQNYNTVCNKSTFSIEQHVHFFWPLHFCNQHCIKRTALCFQKQVHMI